jgi:hypothetical protein
MTTITNVHDLPEPLVAAIMNDGYDRGDADISVTGLLNPPRIAALEARYAEHLTDDASDRIWLLLGRSVHNILERAGETGLREMRLFTDVCGWKVSGQFDHLALHEEQGKLVLYDYKVTSVWTLVYGERLHEWEAQLNMYALLLAEHGYEVDEIKVVAILRDWSRTPARMKDGYPKLAVQVVDLHLWSVEETQRLMEQRVRAHQAAREKMPQCSPEERWAKEDRWAVYTLTKAGARRARADRVFDSPADADEYAAAHGGEVEYRQGDQWVRCRDYCSVAQFCTQYMEGDSAS